ncbi:DUF5064 family protein [Phytopseudomonas punonensis]|uniref:DUF5064 domain-containing protein n=1 Tax=Phytopseudomonas punonensis TaxID=1220495 RepID=A0A1M7CGY7_9GAMM|nr:DUF5064 family protein [Pseudomonas punonensis]SHL66109.1 protein of unknown function [Pseudomonas punonensis]
MFEPGHFHRSNSVATADIPIYAIDLHYDIRQDAAEGSMLYMTLKGEIGGTAFEESFELHRDTAFNFASVVSRLSHKYGLPTSLVLISHEHEEFDLMFEDIRHRLDAHSGEPVDLDHLEKDGL